jgi:predicted transposase YdaD
LWHGSYQNQTQLWLRWWDQEGNLLLIGAERAELAQQAQRDAIPRLLAMGLSVEQVAQALSLAVEEVQQIG